MVLRISDDDNTSTRAPDQGVPPGKLPGHESLQFGMLAGGEFRYGETLDEVKSMLLSCCHGVATRGQQHELLEGVERRAIITVARAFGDQPSEEMPDADYQNADVLFILTIGLGELPDVVQLGFQASDGIQHPKLHSREFDHHCATGDFFGFQPSYQLQAVYTERCSSRAFDLKELTYDGEYLAERIVIYRPVDCLFAKDRMGCGIRTVQVQIGTSEGPKLPQFRSRVFKHLGPKIYRLPTNHDRLPSRLLKRLQKTKAIGEGHAFRPGLAHAVIRSGRHNPGS